jgi:hypothetical protein
MTASRPFDDAELIERLGTLATDIAWPATPDLAGRVTAAIQAAPARTAGTPGFMDRVRDLLGIGGVGAPGGRRVARRSLVIALIALLAIAVAAAAIGIGVPGIRIQFQLGPIATPTPTASAPGPSSSTAVASPGATARPTPPGQDLGPVVSLDQARADTGFGVLVPTATGLTDPPEVHLIGARPFTRVALWFPDQRTLLTEFLGEIQPDAFQKIVGGGSTVEPVKVGQADGWWISGAAHELMLAFRDPDGQVRWQQVTVTGNVLVWQAGPVTLRVETPLDRDAAIALAASLH